MLLGPKQSKGRPNPRMREKDPGFFVQLAALLVPDAVRKALVDMWINEGLTDADVRAMFERMLRERKH